MMNKPRGYVTTVSDELDRRCVMDLLEDVEERVYPIGRLDRNSEGLLLFTNDGEFANSIMHPSRHIAKTYRVTVRPDISDDQLVQLSSGIEIDGRKTMPANVVVKEKQQGRVVMLITIHEGRNRQIRKMCEAVGLEVARLRRVSIGPLRLGMLKPGAWRELTADELRALRTAIGKEK
jgi:23S rRNA pseudouridine2605 synthase